MIKPETYFRKKHTYFTWQGFLRHNFGILVKNGKRINWVVKSKLSASHLFISFCMVGGGGGEDVGSNLE